MSGATGAAAQEALVAHLPQNHAIQRINPVLRAELAASQASLIDNAFHSAADFLATVAEDVGHGIDIPPELQDRAASDVADLPFSEIRAMATTMLAESLPLGPAGETELNAFARRAQLLRAFRDPDHVLDWVSDKVATIVHRDMPKTAADIEVGRNPGDVLDPFLVAATQSLLSGKDFRQAIETTVGHKCLMILEGLMGHLHEQVVGWIRGNVKNPEPRGDAAEFLDPMTNPFPGADVLQPPAAAGGAFRLHQVKSKTGTANSSGGKRLSEQMRLLRMRYTNVELYSHALVGNTLRGHRSMGGMLRVEPSLIVVVGEASFRVLTGSATGGELLLQVYQAAFEKAAEVTGYKLETVVAGIVDEFRQRAEAEGEGFLQVILHDVTHGTQAQQDSRHYPRRLLRAAVEEQDPAPARRPRP